MPILVKVVPASRGPPTLGGGFAYIGLGVCDSQDFQFFPLQLPGVVHQTGWCTLYRCEVVVSASPSLFTGTSFYLLAGLTSAVSR